MNVYKYKAFCLLFLVNGILFLTGCNHSGSDNATPYLSPKIVYGEADTLKGEPLVEYLAGNSFRAYYTPAGFLGSMEMDKKYIHLADTLTGEIIASAGGKGRGPGELLTAHYSDYDPRTGLFYIVDVFRSVVMAFKEEQGKVIVKDEYNLQSAIPSFIGGFQVVSDSVFVVLLNRQYSHCLFLVDNKNTILDSLDYHVFEDDRIDHSKVEHISLSLRMSPDRKNLIVCNSRYNYFRNYEIRNNQFVLTKERQFFELKAEIRDGELWSKDEEVPCYGTIFVSDSYIYMVSNPRSVKLSRERHKKAKGEGTMAPELMNDSYILIFDRDFNFITSYLCDGHFQWITLMPDGKTVYAADYKDKQSLRKYILPELK